MNVCWEYVTLNKSKKLHVQRRVVEEVNGEMKKEDRAFDGGDGR